MRKIFVLLLACIVTLAASSQTVKLSTVKAGTTINIQKVVFNNADIVLDNATIQCMEIEITNAVKKITITGQVIIKCSDFSLIDLTAPIELKLASGSLTIEYANAYSDNGNMGFWLNSKERSTKLSIKRK